MSVVLADGRSFIDDRVEAGDFTHGVCLGCATIYNTWADYTWHGAECRDEPAPRRPPIVRQCLLCGAVLDDGRRFKYCTRCIPRPSSTVYRHARAEVAGGVRRMDLRVSA